MRNSHLALFVLGVLTLAILGNGCSGDGTGGTPEPVSSTVDTDAGGTGVLAGRVVFQGTVPPPRQIQVNKDVEQCRQAEGEVQDVGVSPEGGLEGVVIEIQGIRGKGERTWEDPAEGYVIRQKDCSFQPLLQVAPIAAELVIYNDDPVTHNINTGQWNEVQGPNTEVPLKKPIRGRGFVRVNCNIHSWMEAWVYVAQSPYYAVAGTDGSFRIEGVPPGSYRVTATHPTLGSQRFEITVAGGQAVEQTVTFQQP